VRRRGTRDGLEPSLTPLRGCLCSWATSSCGPYPTRTGNLLLAKQLLYQIELRALGDARQGSNLSYASPMTILDDVNSIKFCVPAKVDDLTIPLGLIKKVVQLNGPID
jgi:hypothetical protein